MNTNIIAFNSRKLKKSNVWITFIFLGWSYGSMNQMGKQILYYLTCGGFGLWTLYRLFTLNSKIDQFNYNLAVELGLTESEMNMFDVYECETETLTNLHRVMLGILLGILLIVVIRIINHISDERDYQREVEKISMERTLERMQEEQEMIQEQRQLLEGREERTPDTNSLRYLLSK